MRRTETGKVERESREDGTLSNSEKKADGDELAEGFAVAVGRGGISRCARGSDRKRENVRNDESQETEAEREKRNRPSRSNRLVEHLHRELEDDVGDVKGGEEDVVVVTDKSKVFLQTRNSSISDVSACESRRGSQYEVDGSRTLRREGGNRTSDVRSMKQNR